MSFRGVGAVANEVHMVNRAQFDALGFEGLLRGEMEMETGTIKCKNCIVMYADIHSGGKAFENTMICLRISEAGRLSIHFTSMTHA